MGAEFTFFDYVDAGGVNVIHTWLEAMPIKVKAKFNKGLLHLEGTPLGQWTRPFAAPLDEQCAGVFELRVPMMGRQYRILACHNGQRPMLLVPFIKRGDAVPPARCEEARTLRDQVLDNPAKYQVEHNYG